ncbi:hypothetical protein DA103_19410 [Enterobacter cloacae]|uniref:Uncharacterized protein n=1 Tax=Enterobacter cloacae TaxID=550 RepID=A0A2T4XW74_ENTCL|nr:MULTISPECIES: hypothetical protein [Enterobacteriaceae]HBR1318827.1 hypothetical protein [Klebsiella quasipneumoniae subsp. quasipneumoniae]HDH1382399.1 hypothetical protein [Klebsiella quasipneumoniae subsp. similipneumoniae]AVO79445.1 hypothetical protein AM459_20995 [Klebsiella pneumoniae]EKV8437085.1 hypothetical protein [Klebsiella variicola]KMH49714.1 hypothetical protein SM73_01621 [Klebsiella quasipneumoniae]
MLILPKLFIIEVYGLKDIFEKEPIYIIFRESDGVILSHAYDLQGASSKLKSLLEKNNYIPDDVINNGVKKEHMDEMFRFVVPGYATYSSKTNKVNFKSFYLQQKGNESIALFLKPLIEKESLANIIIKKSKEDNTPS